MCLGWMYDNMISGNNRMLTPDLVDKNSRTRNDNVIFGLRRVRVIRIVLLASGDNRELNIEWMPASPRANIALSAEGDGHLAPDDLKRSRWRFSILWLHR